MDIKTKIASLQAEIDRLSQLEEVSTSLHDWCIGFGMNPPESGEFAYYKDSPDDDWRFCVILPSPDFGRFEVLLSHNDTEVDVIDETFETAQETLEYLQQMPPLVACKATAAIQLEVVSCNKDYADASLEELLDADAFPKATITYTDVPIEWKLPNKSQ